MSKREQTSCSSSANECPAGIYAEGILAACARFNKKCRLMQLCTCLFVSKSIQFFIIKYVGANYESFLVYF